MNQNGVEAILGRFSGMYANGWKYPQNRLGIANDENIFITSVDNRYN